uniref:(northern house mosquito) hypothetical protein n=1 Tax=Culex pipiens TaxID=7175 RepID=A0A8D8PDM1_CULPI
MHLIHSDIVNTHNSILSAYNCKIHGIIYKNGTFVTYTQDDVTELYEIVEILNIDSSYFLVGQLWQCGGLDDHFLAQEVIKPTLLHRLLSLSELDGPPIMIHSINHKQYFRIKRGFYNDEEE